MEPLRIQVVTHDSGPVIEECLDALARHCPGVPVLVLDNASRDDTRARVRGRAGVELLEVGHNLGFGTAHNLGMRARPAARALLLNPDATLTGDLPGELLDLERRSGPLGIAGFEMAYPDGTHHPSSYSFASPAKWILQDLGLKEAYEAVAQGWLGRALRPLVRRLPGGTTYLAGRPEAPPRERTPVDWVTGACMLVTRRAYEATGGFAEELFLYGEDEELCFRARRAGVPVERLALGPVLHRGRSGKRPWRHCIDAVTYESYGRVIERCFRERPVQRWLMRRLLAWRHQRWRRRVGR